MIVRHMQFRRAHGPCYRRGKFQRGSAVRQWASQADTGEMAVQWCGVREQGDGAREGWRKKGEGLRV